MIISKKCLCLLIIVIISGASSWAYADQLSPSELHALGTQRTWLQLLKFKILDSTDTSTLKHSEKSAAKSQKNPFFLADNGIQDPVAELTETILIFSNPSHPKYQMAACQFPARYYWLRQRLPHLIQQPPQCDEFEAWRDHLNAIDVYLVFPVAYMNSPSSMFGHTFLRLKSGHRENPLLDYAVNFAANADESENTILYSLRGLTGGYPGGFGVVPFYDKIKEYSFLDSRDIWEYKLQLNTAEVNQLIRHLWELQGVEFDYYFFNDNCSYRLVSLLASISNRIELTDQFQYRAIPVDTIRFLSQTPGFSNVSYRPSEITQLRHFESQLDRAALTRVKEMVLAPEFLLEGHEYEMDSQILDVAYRYSRYLGAKQKKAYEHLPKRSIELLSQRAKAEEVIPFTPPLAPLIRDDQGHNTLTLTQGWTYFKDRDQIKLGIRGAYHDQLDPISGYPEGAQLNLFDLTIRVDKTKLILDRLAFVDIQSYTPVSKLIQPKSWSVGFGVHTEPRTEKVSGYLHTGLGRAWRWHNMTFRLLGSAQVQLFSDKALLEAGPQFGFTTQGQRWSTTMTTTPFFGSLSQFERHWFTNFGMSRHFESWQLRVNFSYSDTQLESFYQAFLGARLYL